MTPPDSLEHLKKYFFYGTIDEALLWDRALDSSEVIDVYLFGLKSTASFNKSDVRINFFPNPASDELKIEVNQSREYISYRVLNSLGQTLIEQEIDGSLTKVDISGLNKVSYIVQILHSSNRIIKSDLLIKN